MSSSLYAMIIEPIHLQMEIGYSFSAVGLGVIQVLGEDESCALLQL
jgi:hypothetical protein